MPADDYPTALHATPPPASASSGVPSFGEHAGDMLGPYKLLEVLGEGGFGVVWLAERREPFYQRVAIKVVKPGMDSREVIARFEQERQALAVMDHPNVARVHDAGATSRGRPYFVMELVTGEPITDYCDKHRLTIRQRLELFIPVCEAVQHAHQKGIIHRDLKPSNILIGSRDGEPAPKVIDFGVAKAISHALTDKTIFTESGQMIGTPEYMSPEQAEMKSGDIDTRSDVYSLGAVLYELLTGGAPFETHSLRANGFGGLVDTIRNVDPPRPSTRLTLLTRDQSGAIAQHRRVAREVLAAELKRELEWIPLKALRKDRRERYGSPADLARDIRNYLHGRPLEAGPESTTYRLRKLARRNKGVVAAAGLIAASLVAGIVAFAWQARAASIERDAALAAQQSTDIARAAEERERKKSQAINQFMLDALRASDPNQGGRQDMLVAEAMSSAMRRLDDGAFKGQPDVESNLRFTIAEVLDGNARSGDALAMAQRGLDIAQKSHAGDHPDVAKGLGIVGTCLHTLGRDVEALPKFESALAMLHRLRGNGDDADIALATGNLAESLGALGRWNDALPKYEQSLAMSRRIAPGDDARVATGMNNLAFCLQALGRAPEALPMYQNALEMQKRLYAGDHPDVARGLNNVGYCLQAMGRAGDALPMYQQALDMRRRMFKGDHPAIARAITNVAGCQSAAGKPAEALAMYEDALATWRRVYSGDHPEVAMGITSTAVALHQLGRAPESLARFEEALVMRKRLHSGDHVDVATALNNVGRERFLLKRPAEAEAPLRESVAMYQRVAPGDTANTANATANLAACLNALGKANEALPLAEHSAAMASRVLPDGGPIRTKCEGILAEIRKVTGVETKP